jgi:hypothetical protein
MVTQQRGAFEKHFKTTGFFENAQDSAIYNQSRFDVFDINNGFYRNPYVQLAWETWQAALAQAVPKGMILVFKELPENIAENMAIDRVEKPSSENNPIWIKIAEDAYKGRLQNKKWELWRDYKEMIELQEQNFKEETPNDI